MEILKNPVTVKQLASQLIIACDNYISQKIPEKQFRELITYYATRHGKKLFARNGFNPTVVIKIGKKRVELVKIMLSGFQTSLLD